MTKDKLYTICKGIYDWLSTISKVQEESLTDWLVYQITKKSALSKKKIICKTFSKPEEGKKTGADIELWILTGSGIYPYRIQAKKLSADAKENAKSFAYTTRKGGNRQYDLLVNDANNKGMTPLYMFYQKEYTKIPPTMLCSKYSNDCGAIITDAILYNDYAHEVKKSCDAVDIVQKSYPLPCLLCFKKSCQKCIIPSPYDGNLPSYVIELLETGTIKNGNELKSCKKLIVIDKRKKQ